MLCLELGADDGLVVLGERLVVILGDAVESDVTILGLADWASL